MKTKARRTEIEVGPEIMLKLAGWEYTGPKNKKCPSWLKCWVNPRTGKSYTLEGATAIEELKDSL